MPTYVTLVKFTQKGVEDIKHGPDRLATAKERARARGGEISVLPHAGSVRRGHHQRSSQRRSGGRGVAVCRIARLYSHREPACFQRGGVQEDRRGDTLRER